MAYFIHLEANVIQLIAFPSFLGKNGRVGGA